MVFCHQDLHAQLCQFEPRVASMREIADQVFAQSAAADSAQLRSKLTVLSDRLTSLLKICAQYKQLLDGALRNRGAVLSPSTPTGLNTLSSSPASPGARNSPHRSIVVLPVEVSAFNPCFPSHIIALKHDFHYVSFIYWHSFYFISLCTVSRPCFAVT